MMTTETKETVSNQLAKMGFSLTYTVNDGGGYSQESVFDITLAKGGLTYTTEYRKGPGHRIWVKKPLDNDSGYWHEFCQLGQRVGLSAFNLKEPDKCKPGFARERQRDVFREFAELTQAIPPSLDEVMHSLLIDANCVRHGQSFEEMCSEIGYDTDSRCAEKTYNQCRDTWSALVRMKVDFDELDELFHHY